MNKKHAALFGEIKSAIDSDMDSDDVLRFVCHILYDGVEHFNWVGFYKYNPAEQTLSLKQYVGEETDHTEIPYGRGICGQVALSGKKLVVPDVALQDNYLSCSINVKSEVVIPISRAGVAIAQLDIDSHYTDPFTKEDIELLEEVCTEVAPFF